MLRGLLVGWNKEKHLVQGDRLYGRFYDTKGAHGKLRETVMR